MAGFLLLLLLSVLGAAAQADDPLCWGRAPEVPFMRMLHRPGDQSAELQRVCHVRIPEKLQSKVELRTKAASPEFPLNDSHMKLSFSVGAWGFEEFAEDLSLRRVFSGKQAVVVGLTGIDDIEAHGPKEMPGFEHGQIFFDLNAMYHEAPGTLAIRTDKPCWVVSIARQSSGLTGSGLLVVLLTWIDQFGEYWGCKGASLNDDSSIKELYMLKNYAFWYQRYGFSYNVEQPFQSLLSFKQACTKMIQELSKTSSAFATLERTSR
ncbi:unnamed protein product [Vitrella brassicaformis CCMP3155]|uniref:Uncharacterized protein n=2 Tax=Vitrella brassicaformis TaxID=1169539 RepID=A0A0G4EUX3_VITBC|nr:unnamed protein product [Vitrella brassicaformis CCMP3155]|eukprot:CEM02400.1 unnamed protein product [Vitrella brassicaformis CCMP3155]